MTKIAALLLTLMAIISLATACGSGESQEDIATEVARTWTLMASSVWQRRVEAERVRKTSQPKYVG